MEKDDYLEMVSDEIRKGRAVSILDALAAIDYQSALRDFRKQNTLWRRFIRWICA